MAELDREVGRKSHVIRLDGLVKRGYAKTLDTNWPDLWLDMRKNDYPQDIHVISGFCAGDLGRFSKIREQEPERLKEKIYDLDYIIELITGEYDKGPRIARYKRIEGERPEKSLRGYFPERAYAVFIPQRENENGRVAVFYNVKRALHYSGFDISGYEHRVALERAKF